MEYSCSNARAISYFVEKFEAVATHGNGCCVENFEAFIATHACSYICSDGKNCEATVATHGYYIVAQ